MEYYAHISDDGLRRQTVTEHCRATAHYAAECLSGMDLSKAAYLAGLLHDAGKFSSLFQAYLESAAREEPVRRGSVVHTFAGVRFLLEQYHGTAPLSFDDIACELLAFAVGAHHGLFDCVDENHASGFCHRLSTHDNEYRESMENFLAHCAGQAELDGLVQEACAELGPVFERIGELISSEPAESTAHYFYVGLTARLLLSAVIQGDRRDTAEFQTGSPRPEDLKDKRELWNTCLQHLEGELEKLSHAPGKGSMEIQRARQEISHQCRQFAERPGGIYQLNVPTGAGKTLSSLRYALAHAARWNKSRIIFTAPLLTILDQNAEVIKEYVGDNSIILEHHSNLVRPREETEELNVQELLMEDWSAPVIITTLAQLLNTLLDGKTSSIRRFQALSNSVIILDEVQTVPAKMLTLFNLAVNFLAEVCGATVILCSATQPCLKKTAHPLVSDLAEMVPYDPAVWEVFRRTRIQPAGRMRLAEIPAFAMGVLEQAESLLIVCNKKDEAAELYEKLSGSDFRCYHLSAAMCMAHRRKVLKELEAALENLKSAPQESREKILCVSTQVMEAGVDLSFQRVIRLSAGMDSVVQSAGRCNRNGESGSPAPVYLVQCQDENLAKLTDIQRGKDATESLMARYSRRPADFQEDLSSKAAIDAYYQTLYREMPEGFQDDPVRGKPYSIFSLLADNSCFADERAESFGSYFLNQAFRLAGRLFQVYDDDHLDVIVPYESGKEVIAALGSEQAKRNLEYRKAWLEKAKPYTISLYDYQRRRLEEKHGLWPVRDGDTSTWALSEGFYKKEIGFSIEETSMQFLEV